MIEEGPLGGTKSRRRRWLRLTLRAFGVVLLGGLLVVGISYLQARPALGRAPEGERLDRIQNSPQWGDGAFGNPEPLEGQTFGAFRELAQASEDVTPSTPIPVARDLQNRFESSPESDLRITWLGHSTNLIEIDGTVVLTDPVWGPRASPLSWAGPKRWYDPPVPLEDLPPVDAVLISHDHYDHLDYPTIIAMSEWDTQFVVPLGIGAHLESWGVEEERIVELDWWDRHPLGSLEIVLTPARHASGRHLFDGNRTLWAGFALLGPEHRVFFSGDTGMFPGMREIGAQLGPFDVTLIEVGTYAQSWADWHLGPEQAVEAHALLRGNVFLPIHWGLFNLSTHGWTEPIERVLAAAERSGVTALTLRPGEAFEPDRPLQIRRWWPNLPWRTFEEYPVVSSRLEDLDPPLGPNGRTTSPGH